LGRLERKKIFLERKASFLLTKKVKGPFRKETEDGADFADDDS
jgi:hypothetical protein